MDIGSILVNQQFAVPVTLYDTEKLQADLSAGVANVMAGVGGAHVLDINTENGFAIFRHKDAAYDAGPGAGYAGDLRCALGITSNGLMAGFNRKIDGAWVNSLVIDATTGSATFTGAINAESGNFTGTVTAGSIITGSVTIAGSAGNTTLDAIIAASGSYTTSDLDADLAAGVGKVVAGTGSDYRLTVDPANGFIVAGRNGSVFKGTATPGTVRPALGISANGIAMGANRSSDGLWVDGVAIDSSGNASFSGEVNATSGNFTGTVTAGSFVSRNAIVGQTVTNKLLWSEEFDNWEQNSTSTTANVVAAPDGTMTGDRIVAQTDGAFVNQPVTATAGETNTFSIYLRADIPTSIHIGLADSPSWVATTALCNITTEWQRFSVTRTTGSGTTYVYPIIGGYGTFTTGEIIDTWGAQLEDGSVATDYIKTEGTAVTKTAKTLDEIATGATGYTAEELQADLTSGVGKILAGVGSNYRMNIDTSASAIILGHKDALYGVSTGAYATDLRTALAITASGIAMGYNRKSDGAWINAIAISASGTASFAGHINATSGSFTGTLEASSIIAGSATVDGVTMSTIRANAAAGATAVQPPAIAGMLTASSSYILGGTVSVTSAGQGIKTGTITWDANGTVTSGSGVAITSKGIVGAASGVPTFSINGTTGAATFKGDITGATGAFAGTVSAANIVAGTITAAISINSAGSINATGVYGSAVGDASVVGAPGATGSIGVAGISGAGVGVFGRATTGHGVRGQSNTTSGIGVYGSGGIGVFGVSGTTTGIDLYAGGSGRIALGGTSIQLRGTGGVIRATDSYTTDAYLLMISAYGAGAGATATLGPRLGSNSAMAGWMTARVGSALVYVPYWT